MTQLTRLCRFTAVVTLVLVSFLTVVVTGQSPALGQLVITEARPDSDADTLTVSGENFGTRPVVTLDLVPLRIEEATETQIVAVAPISLMPASEYLLTVSRGPSASEHASFDVFLGSTSPETTTGALAEAPTDGETLPMIRSDAQSEVAVQVGDRVITVDEIDNEWQRADPASYIAFQQQTYETRRQIADRVVADELLAIEARNRGISVDELLEQELPPRTVSMPDAAVRALYQGLGPATRRNTFEQLEPALRAWLSKVTEPELARANYIEELMQVSTEVNMSLVAPRIRIDRTDQDAVMGSESAAIELVVFGDFQNAEYARFAEQFSRVLETFGDRLRIVFKNLPALDRAAALSSAEAAQCAKDQDTFWSYHDLLLAQQGIFDTIRLKQLASDVGLDRDQFDRCLDNGIFRPTVQSAVEEARRYAIQGSPSFLINGRFAPAPPAFLPPFEFFTRLIEEELAAQTASPAAR